MEVPARFAVIYDPRNERRNTAQHIINALMTSKKFQDAPDKLKIGIVVGIERGILNYAVQFMEDHNKIPSWVLNSFVDEFRKRRMFILCALEKIGQPSYSFLEDIIMMRKIEWHLIAAARPHELNPIKFAPIINTLKIRSEACIEFNYIDGFIACFNCGSKKYKEYSIQLRGLDEPAHLFKMCGGCGVRTRG